MRAAREKERERERPGEVLREYYFEAAYLGCWACAQRDRESEKAKAR